MWYDSPGPAGNGLRFHGARIVNRTAIASNRGRSDGPPAGMLRLTVGALIALVMILGSADSRVWADIYRYRDRNGNWVLTDSPPDHAERIEIVRERDGRSSGSYGFRDIEAELAVKYRPKNEIERASLSAVTIKTAIGMGSGFFINGNGYILTNRHVVRGDEAQIRETERFIAQMDDWMADEEADIAQAENQIERMKSDLNDFKASIDHMTDPNAQGLALQRYRDQSARYDSYEERLRKRKDELQEKGSKHRRQKEEFSRKARTAGHESRFAVILKDGSELEADLVSVSEDQDLALLRMSGCRSPFIHPAAQSEIFQGLRVFAIGSPLGVGDSVSAGIVSGYDDDYIRTDAKVYPGNSGGPLITGDGKVIGINTLKLITRKFEGMGFAIPVRRAFREFAPYLGPVP